MNKVYTWRLFFILIAPITILYLSFVFFPLFVSFYYSFTNFRGIGTPDFIGLRNYAALFGDRFFYISLKNTLLIMVTSIAIGMPLSFLCANYIYKCGNAFKSEIYKVILYAPNTIGGIIVGLMWTFMLDPHTGFINLVLRSLGLDFLALDWIGGKSLTPYSAGVISSWSSVGFYMVIWLAGLKAIPYEIYESSYMDGATPVQQMFYLTIPMVKESFKALFILGVTGGLKAFETVYMLTGGGPVHYSETMVSYMYSISFRGKRQGYGIAMGVITFMIALLITGVFLFLSRKKEETE
jgi:raffinose/stachyose/melibiose transport system permease protein